MEIQLKTVDERGRLVLGKSYANKVAQLQQIGESEFRIVFVQAVPESEMWLYKNEDAKMSVFRGLQQAATGKLLADGPDVLADARQFGEEEDA